MNLQDLIPKEKIKITYIQTASGEEIDRKFITFASKKDAVKAIRSSALPGWAVYDLGKHNEVEIENGENRTLKITVEELE